MASLYGGFRVLGKQKEKIRQLKEKGEDISNSSLRSIYQELVSKHTDVEDPGFIDAEYSFLAAIKSDWSTGGVRRWIQNARREFKISQ